MCPNYYSGDFWVEECVSLSEPLLFAAVDGAEACSVAAVGDVDAVAQVVTVVVASFVVDCVSRGRGRCSEMGRSVAVVLSASRARL